MRGGFCMLLLGVFLQFSGGQRFQGTRRIFQRPELGRQFRNVDVLTGTPNSQQREIHSNADQSALQSAQHLRLRNFRSRSGLASNSRTSSNSFRAEDISVNSRGVPRRNNSPTPSRLNLRLRASQHESVASSLPSEQMPFSRVSQNHHQSSSNLHHAQREITRQSHDFQSSFPVRGAGNDARNQASTQDAQLVRELQLLNSLLKENNTPSRTDHSANHNTVNTDFGSAISTHHMGNVNDHIHQQPLQLPSHQSHDISLGSPNHLNVDVQPKIVLLRNRNSGKPLNVQIGNTRLEVLGSQSDSSQLIIQTLQNALSSTPQGAIANQNVASHVPGNAATHVPVDNQSLINVATGNTQTGQVNANPNPANTNTILELLNQLQMSSTATGSTGPNPQIQPSVAAANVPGPSNLNNINIPLITTAAPVHVPMVTTPLAPSAALRQILGPGVSDAMLQRMAQEILPSELQRIDAIMTGKGKNQVPDPSNVAVLKVGNQTHTFDMGTTKKIKIEQYKNGPRAEVTSFNGSGTFKNRMVTEEPLEYDEILLRKVLQKMGGR